MKKIISLFCVLLFGGVISVKAQDYLQIVSLESDNGTQAVFSSAGAAENKKVIETY